MNLRTLIFTLTIVSLIGCSKHDVPYYEANLDKAETKLKECQDEAIEAISNKDTDKFESIQSDTECKAAQKAISISKQKARIKLMESKPIIIDETPLLP